MAHEQVQGLLQFLKESPTAFHAVESICSRLTGFEPLQENARWRLQPGGRYYVTRNRSSVIAFTVPQRGDKCRLTEMADKNAREEILIATTKAQRSLKTLEWLQRALELDAPPERIEAFDISNLGDSGIVAGMTVFQHGRPRKSDYRKFRIRTTDGQNDYGAMHEALTRRFQHYLDGDPGFCPLPDLLLIDGGADLLVGETLLYPQEAEAILTAAELEGAGATMITYSMQILMSLMMLSMIFVMLTMAQASGKRICEVLDETSSLQNPAEPVYDVKNGDVDFDHVNFKYSAAAKRSALSDVDFHVRSGQTVGIIGGTGSSKTSLVQLICRLYDVTDGSVRVGGRDVRAYDLETLRNQVAVVLQKNVLFSGTIKENLRWGDPNATDAELQRACELACADEFIQQMPDKYDTYIEQGGTNVSGGQKQRLCIARALLKKPKILILDDSTSAVDTKTDAKIRAALRTEIPETTKFIIAQRISSIQDADLILVLDGGAINGMGTHETLLSSNQIYQEVYYSQNRTGGADNG